VSTLVQELCTADTPPGLWLGTVINVAISMQYFTIRALVILITIVRLLVLRINLADESYYNICTLIEIEPKVSRTL
jgi:hypothetical protein